jgi:hypothetical protein
LTWALGRWRPVRFWEVLLFVVVFRRAIVVIIAAELRAIDTARRVTARRRVVIVFWRRPIRLTREVIVVVLGRPACI